MAGQSAVRGAAVARARIAGLQITVGDRATQLAALRSLQVLESSLEGTEHSALPVVVASRPFDAAGTGQIVVVSSTPAASAEALKAVTSGMARGALTVDELDRLPSIVSAAYAGLRCVSDDLVKLAAALPSVGERGRVVLQLASTGASVAQMSSSLHVSTATIKRELAELADEFGVGSRVELLLAARNAGIL